MRTRHNVYITVVECIVRLKIRKLYVAVFLTCHSRLICQNQPRDKWMHVSGDISPTHTYMHCINSTMQLWKFVIALLVLRTFWMNYCTSPRVAHRTTKSTNTVNVSASTVLSLFFISKHNVQWLLTFRTRQNAHVEKFHELLKTMHTLAFQMKTDCEANIAPIHSVFVVIYIFLSTHAKLQRSSVNRKEKQNTRTYTHSMW